MEIKYRKTSNNLTIYIYGDLDEHSAPDAKCALDALIKDNLNVGRVIFDLSGLSFMDSTGVGLLIGRYKILKQFQVPCYISGATLAAEKVICISGLYKIMPKY